MGRKHHKSFISDLFAVCDCVAVWIFENIFPIRAGSDRSGGGGGGAVFSFWVIGGARDEYGRELENRQYIKEYV